MNKTNNNYIFLLIFFVLLLLINTKKLIADIISESKICYGSLYINWIGVIDNGEGDYYPHGPWGNFHYIIAPFDYTCPPNKDFDWDDKDKNVLPGPSNNEFIDGDEIKYDKPIKVYNWTNEKEKIKLIIYESDPNKTIKICKWGFCKTILKTHRDDDPLFCGIIDRQDTISSNRLYFDSNYFANEDAVANINNRPSYENDWIKKITGQEFVDTSYPKIYLKAITNISEDINYLGDIIVIDNNCIAKNIAAGNGYLYWIDYGKNYLYRGRIDNNKYLSDIIVVDTNCIADIIAAGGEYIYWKDIGQKNLYRGKIVNGCIGDVIVIDTNCIADIIAAGGEYIYWKDIGQKNLYRGKVVNEKLVDVIIIDANCTAEIIAADERYVYWKDINKNNLYRGIVNNEIIGNVIIIDSNCMSEIIAADNNNLFWKDKNQKLLYMGKCFHSIEWVINPKTSIQIFILPEIANNMGAKWRLNGGEWKESGNTISNLPINDNYIVDFVSISGYITPLCKDIELNKNPNKINVNYIKKKGSIQVNIYPIEVIEKGALWRINEGNWNRSNELIELSVVDKYLLECNSIAGWIIPEKQSVTIIDEKTTFKNIYYRRRILAPKIIDFNCKADILAVEDDYIFWKDYDRHFLYKGTIINGNISNIIIIDSNCDAELFTVEGEYLYWKDRNKSNLYCGKIINGRIADVTIIDSNCDAEILSASVEYLYWKDRNKSNLYCGRIVNEKISDVTIIDSNCDAEFFDVIGKNIYWKDKGKNILYNGRINNGSFSDIVIIDSNCVAEVFAAHNEKIFWKDFNNNNLYQSNVNSYHNTGSLQIVINPIDVINKGGAWRVDGGEWLDSGKIISNLSVSEVHTIEYKPVDCWSTPQKNDIIIEADKVLTKTGNYNLINYTVTGFIKNDKMSPLSDIIISVSNEEDIYTDINGYYKKSLKCGWSGNFTPFFKCYTPNIVQYEYLSLRSDYVNQDFVVIPEYYIISGSIKNTDGKGESGVKLDFNNSGFTYTDEKGNYNHKVSCNWNGNVTPCASDTALYSPIFYSYSNVTSNKYNMNYTRTNKEINVSSLTATFSSKGGKKIFSVKSNVKTNLISNSDWLSICYNSEADIYNFTLTCQPNPINAIRTSTILITAIDEINISKTIQVVQSEKYSYPLSESILLYVYWNDAEHSFFNVYDPNGSKNPEPLSLLGVQNQPAFYGFPLIIQKPYPDWKGYITISLSALDNERYTNYGSKTFNVSKLCVYKSVDLDNFISNFVSPYSEIKWETNGLTHQLNVSIDSNKVANIQINSSEYSGSETITFTTSDSNPLTDFSFEKISIIPVYEVLD